MPDHHLATQTSLPTQNALAPIFTPVNSWYKAIAEQWETGNSSDKQCTIMTPHPLEWSVQAANQVAHTSCSTKFSTLCVSFAANFTKSDSGSTALVHSDL